MYGTTDVGGILVDPGTVFKVNTDGSDFNLLKEFNGSDGRWPNGGLVLSGRTLYGTTTVGGGDGTVFKIDTDGSGYTVLHRFTGYPADGHCPSGGLVLSGTTLYGVTGGGGAYGGPAGSGTLFKVNTDGSGYSILKQFRGTDGAGPGGALVLSGTTLFGVTEGGGTFTNGTIFKLSADGGDYTVLHDFVGWPSDGASPRSGLALSGTTLYGTTRMGGSHGYSPAYSDYGDGTVFRISTDGSGYRMLKEFVRDDGRWPSSGLLIDGATLYGVATSGGISDHGVVFSLSLPLPAILRHPMSQTVEAGSSVFFRVRTEDDPSLIYQWFVNGTNAISVATTNSYLRLTEVQFPQAGVYSVVVTNVFGAVTSAPAILSVIPAVERRLVPALTLIGQAGRAVNLEDTEAFGPVPEWTSLDTVLLTNGSQWYFDLSAPVPQQRFYRAWQLGPRAVIPALDLHMVPAITLTGAIGNSVCVDYINQFGPIDAWVNLATVTLTNSTQLYFDTSAIGQPPRLWRIVPLP